MWAALSPLVLWLAAIAAYAYEDGMNPVSYTHLCGKSSLLKLMMAHLREQGVMEDQILSMNFESMQFADMDSKQLYQYVMERVPKEKRLYLFLDEVQKVRDWQDAVNSFRVDLDCDIYVTGSNAYLLLSLIHI